MKATKHFWVASSSTKGLSVGEGNAELASELDEVTAHLFQAAPLMLEALELLIATHDGAGERIEPEWVLARKALEYANWIQKPQRASL